MKPVLLHGAWRDVINLVYIDAVITDPPFSPRTAEGYTKNPNWQKGVDITTKISYGSIDESDVRDFCDFFCDRVKNWMVIFGDHITQKWWSDNLASMGWYVFAPVIWVKENAPPRFLGDGPASQVEYITVARPKMNIRLIHRRGSRPGWYKTKIGDAAISGAKPLSLMRSIVRDYSDERHIIVDPYAGSGVTLLAAAIENRQAIGTEINKENFEIAKKRLSKGYTPTLF